MDLQPTPDYSRGPESLAGETIDIVDSIQLRFGIPFEATSDEGGGDRLLQSPIAYISYTDWNTGLRMCQMLYLILTKPWSFNLDHRHLERRTAELVERKLNSVFYSTGHDSQIHRRVDHFGTWFGEFFQYQNAMRDEDEFDSITSMIQVRMCPVHDGYQNYIVGCPSVSDTAVYMVWLGRHDTDYPGLEDTALAFGPGVRVIRDDALEFGSQLLGSHEPSSDEGWSRHGEVDVSAAYAKFCYVATKDRKQYGTVSVPRHFRSGGVEQLVLEKPLADLGLILISELSDEYGLWGFAGPFPYKKTREHPMPIPSTGKGIPILMPSNLLKENHRLSHIPKELNPYHVEPVVPVEPETSTETEKPVSFFGGLLKRIGSVFK